MNNYKGKLYGKVKGVFYPLQETTDDIVVISKTDKHELVRLYYHIESHFEVRKIEMDDALKQKMERAKEILEI